MKLKLKEAYTEANIYISFERRNCLGKFIPESLYPHLYNKYPELFEVSIEEEEFFTKDYTKEIDDFKAVKEKAITKIKNNKVNDISVDDSKLQGGSNG